MMYQEFAPQHPHCQKFIECFWTISFAGEDDFISKDLVLPDTGIDWVFNLGDPYLRQTKDGHETYFKSYQSQLIGQRTTAVHIQQSRQTKLMVIRFKPYGLSALGFKENAALTDSVVEDTLVFGELSQRIGDIVAATQDILAVITKIEGILCSYFQNTVPDYLCQFWDQDYTNYQLNQVHRLSEFYGLSRSTISRDFKKYTGVGPKKMLDLLRFKKTVQNILLNENLTALSYDANYCDQAHMIKTFKGITGWSPKQFLKQDFNLPKSFIASTK